MLDSGRVESTELVGFDQTPIVLNGSLRLRVPTDRLCRKFLEKGEKGDILLFRTEKQNVPFFGKAECPLFPSGQTLLFDV
jgi:hypothetical protein